MSVINKGVRLKSQLEETKKWVVWIWIGTWQTLKPISWASYHSFLGLGIFVSDSFILSFIHYTFTQCPLSVKYSILKLPKWERYDPISYTSSDVRKIDSKLKTVTKPLYYLAHMTFVWVTPKKICFTDYQISVQCSHLQPIFSILFSHVIAYWLFYLGVLSY